MAKKNFFIFISAILLFVTDAHCSILCVDIGGTRIKASILHENISLIELQKVHVVAINSSPWWNETLPELFNRQNENSLYHHFHQSYDSVSFGISGPIYDHSIYTNKKRSIPMKLQQECAEITQLPVFVENDAVIWAKGIKYWNKLINNEIRYPSLCVIFGTAIGVVLMPSPNDLIAIEIGFIDCPFYRLHNKSKDQPIELKDGKRSPHKPLGRSFFDWARQDVRSWDEEKITLEFNERVIAFLADLSEYISSELNTDIQSIMIGGGNSRLLSSGALKNELKKNIELYSPVYLKSYKVSPDIISLIGCIERPMVEKVNIHPPWDSIIPMMSME